MSSARAERLVNLVLCLLSTRQYLTAERIRATVPGYAEAPTDEAFFRMFERDKAELRELGIPLETGRHSAFEPADGYRIPRQDYELARRRPRAGRGGRGRARRSAVGLPGAGRRCARRAGEAAGGGDRGGRVRHCRGRAPGAGDRAGVRPAAGRRAVRPGGQLHPPRRADRAGTATHDRAVGCGEPARPLVPGRARPGPGRRAHASGCPGSASRSPPSGRPGEVRVPDGMDLRTDRAGRRRARRR